MAGTDTPADIVLGAIRAAAQARPFSTALAAPALPTDEHAAFVRQVKDLQRSGGIMKQRWSDYADAFGRGVRDPAKHDASFLRQAVAQMQSGAAFPHQTPQLAAPNPAAAMMALFNMGMPGLPPPPPTPPPPGFAGPPIEHLQPPRKRARYNPPPRQDIPPQAPGDSILVSPRGYPLTLHTGPLPSYQGAPVYCDITKQKNLQSLPDGFYHCAFEDFDACREEIEARVIEEMHVTPRQAGIIIGSGAQNLRRLQEEHKTVVFRVPRKRRDPDGTPVRLVGRPEAVKEAREGVERLLGGSRAPMDTVRSIEERKTEEPAADAAQEAPAPEPQDSPADVPATADAPTSPEDHTPDQPSFHEGQRVTAQGLQDAVELNGATGVVQGHDNSDGTMRVLVRFAEPHGQRALKPQNLSPEAAEPEMEATEPEAAAE